MSATASTLALRLQPTTVPPGPSGPSRPQLRVLEVKAVAAESAIEVTEQAMRLCGAAAFRKDVGCRAQVPGCPGSTGDGPHD